MKRTFTAIFAFVLIGVSSGCSVHKVQVPGGVIYAIDTREDREPALYFKNPSERNSTWIQSMGELRLTSDTYWVSLNPGMRVKSGGILSASLIVNGDEQHPIDITGHRNRETGSFRAPISTDWFNTRYWGGASNFAPDGYRIQGRVVWAEEKTCWKCPPRQGDVVYSNTIFVGFCQGNNIPYQQTDYRYACRDSFPHILVYDRASKVQDQRNRYVSFMRDITQIEGKELSGWRMRSDREKYEITIGRCNKPGYELGSVTVQLKNSEPRGAYKEGTSYSFQVTTQGGTSDRGTFTRVPNEWQWVVIRVKWIPPLAAKYPDRYPPIERTCIAMIHPDWQASCGFDP